MTLCLSLRGTSSSWIYRYKWTRATFSRSNTIDSTKFALKFLFPLQTSINDVLMVCLKESWFLFLLLSSYLFRILVDKWYLHLAMWKTASCKQNKDTNAVRADHHFKFQFSDLGESNHTWARGQGEHCLPLCVWSQNTGRKNLINGEQFVWF